MQPYRQVAQRLKRLGSRIRSGLPQPNLRRRLPPPGANKFHEPGGIRRDPPPHLSAQRSRTNPVPKSLTPLGLGLLLLAFPRNRTRLLRPEMPVLIVAHILGRL